MAGAGDAAPQRRGPNNLHERNPPVSVRIARLN